MNLVKNKLSYEFKDKDLLELALTHRSASKKNNERLEFLGDALLNFYITKTLFKKFGDLQEGKLTQIRASLVSRHFLNTLGKELGLTKHLILGKGESTENNSILGNTLEAIIGAIYIDKGLQESFKVLAKIYEKRINNIQPEKDSRDSKSQLQEKLQKLGYELPSYKVIDHGASKGNTRFEVICRLKEPDISSTGLGKNKKSAEQEAASLILQLYLNDG